LIAQIASISGPGNETMFHRGLALRSAGLSVGLCG